MKNEGEILKKYLESKGITPYALSKSLGISNQNVYHNLRSKEVSFRFKHKLKMIGITIFEDTGENTPVETPVNERVQLGTEKYTFGTKRGAYNHPREKTINKNSALNKGQSKESGTIKNDFGISEKESIIASNDKDNNMTNEEAMRENAIKDCNQKLFFATKTVNAQEDTIKMMQEKIDMLTEKINEFQLKSKQKEKVKTD